MAQLNNSSNSPFPLSTAQGGSGVNAATLNNLQFIMGGDNGPQTTRIFAGVGMQITYDASNVYFTNPAAYQWYTRTSGSQQLSNANAIIANASSSGALSFYPAYQSNSYNFSARILGIGAGLFTIANPGGVTMKMGNQTVTNAITSTAIGDCIEMISVNSTTFYFIAQQGNFTIS